MSASERAYRHVKDRILDGSLPGGELISEDEIAEALGMSRTPVRAAFGQLEAEGLLRLYPKRGALGVPVSASETEAVMETRWVIERYAIERIIERPGDVAAALAESVAAQATWRSPSSSRPTARSTAPSSPAPTTRSCCPCTTRSATASAGWPPPPRAPPNAASAASASTVNSRTRSPRATAPPPRACFAHTSTARWKRSAAASRRACGGRTRPRMKRGTAAPPASPPPAHPPASRRHTELTNRFPPR